MAKIDLQGFIARPESYHEAFAPIRDLEQVIENNEWHQRQSVFDHSIATFRAIRPTLDIALPELSSFVDQRQRIAQYASSRVNGDHVRADLLSFSALFHDAGKTTTLVMTPDGKTSCPDHAKESAQIFGRVRDLFEVSWREGEYVQNIIAHHHDADAFIDTTGTSKFESEVRTFFTVNREIVIDLLLFYIADFEGCKTCEKIKRLKKQHYEVVFGLIGELTAMFPD